MDENVEGNVEIAKGVSRPVPDRSRKKEPISPADENENALSRHRAR